MQRRQRAYSSAATHSLEYRRGYASDKCSWIRTNDVYLGLQNCRPEDSRQMASPESQHGGDQKAPTQPWRASTTDSMLPGSCPRRNQFKLAAMLSKTKPKEAVAATAAAKAARRRGG